MQVYWMEVSLTLLIIFINIMLISLVFVVADPLDSKDTKVLNDFCKLESKKYLIRRKYLLQIIKKYEEGK